MTDVAAATENTSSVSKERITCQICGAATHLISQHLKVEHPTVTIDDYKRDYPMAPIRSAYAEAQLAAKLKERAPVVDDPVAVSGEHGIKKPKSTEAMHTLFDLGEAKAALNARGAPIAITLRETNEIAGFVPEKDSSYVWDINLLKNVLMGMEIGIPVYLWGHAGTGKSTFFEQCAARTNWGFIRVQHDRYTEPGQIVGMTKANENGTYFDPGLLAIAMRYGMIYCADEYDFAMPGILAVYQAVLEGKPLVIKEADEEWRIVKPHPDFRFVATGNTNGSGDDTGLYAGALQQNYANYTRFGIVERVGYLAAENEQAMLISKCNLTAPDAKRMVDFATTIRDSFERREMANPIGPRELLYAARIGVMRNNMTEGLRVAFINKLPAKFAVKATEVAQRFFGK